MITCSFSGKKIPPGKGIMFIQNDGRVYYFYDRKCEKNMRKLSRKPREVGWTEEFHKVKAVQHKK